MAKVIQDYLYPEANRRHISSIDSGKVELYANNKQVSFASPFFILYKPSIVWTIINRHKAYYYQLI